jgi:hypothetical protein
MSISRAKGLMSVSHGCAYKDWRLWGFGRFTFVYPSPSVLSTPFQLSWGRRKKASLKHRNSITICTASYDRRLECECVYLYILNTKFILNTKCIYRFLKNIITNNNFFPHTAFYDGICNSSTLCSLWCESRFIKYNVDPFWSSKQSNDLAHTRQRWIWVYSIQYTVYSIQYTVYSTQYTVYSIQYTIYSIQCTVYSIQYTVHSMQ